MTQLSNNVVQANIILRLTNYSHIKIKENSFLPFISIKEKLSR